MGYYTGNANTTGHDNTLLGYRSGFSSTTANYNLFSGGYAGANNKTGSLSTYLGYESGYNALADSNTFVGYRSGYSTTSGKSNTFFGSLSGRGNATGSRNTFVGNGAGPANGNGDDNVYLGYTTGNRDGGSRNTFLGTGADALANNLTNATAIGAGAGVAISDAVVLGNRANVGIGTDAPTARLHVRSEQADESGLRLENLTNNSPALTQTDKVLTVNERGEVVLARPTAGKLFVKSKADWADRVFEPGYALRPLAEVAQYVKTNGRLPNVPSADDVVRGYDAPTMDARLLEKVEETMLYVLQLKREVDQLRRQNRQLQRIVGQSKKR